MTQTPTPNNLPGGESTDRLIQLTLEQFLAIVPEGARPTVEAAFAAGVAMAPAELAALKDLAVADPDAAQVIVLAKMGPEPFTAELESGAAALGQDADANAANMARQRAVLASAWPYVATLILGLL